tara:strand:- start:103 stop:1497 length:1395 start_codon:yes stop_codon:yes gene_type:complete
MNYTFTHIPQSVKKINTKYRQIVTKIPTPQSIKILKEIYKKEIRSMHGQLPIVWNKAKGFQVYDKWGNKWIDFSSTIFVANSGHGNRKIIESMKKLLDKPLLHTYNYASEERKKYLNYLIKKTPKNFEKAYLLSSGTEATEASLKLMRLHGKRNNKKKLKVIAFDGNWHGRTLGSQFLSGKKNEKNWIGYHDPNIVHLPFPYPWLNEVKKSPKKFFQNSLKKLFLRKKINPKLDVCGFMIETFQGWGALFYPKEFIKELVKFSKKNNILVTFDEIQAGFGRTGELFGYMHYGVQPDIICCGKGSSSSLPLSIVLGKRNIMDIPEVGSMSSTHSANPLACLAGYENLNFILKNKLITNSRNLGNILHKNLKLISNKYSSINISVHGKGLLASLIFKDKSNKPLSKLCSKISELCFQKGLILVHTGRESIKIGPPLIINKSALKEGIKVIDESILEAINEFNLNVK